jgi:hypothetical protein
MREAEQLRTEWRAAHEEYEVATGEARSNEELERLAEKKDRLKDAYFAKAREAVAALKERL